MFDNWADTSLHLHLLKSFIVRVLCACNTFLNCSMYYKDITNVKWNTYILWYVHNHVCLQSRTYVFYWTSLPLGSTYMSLNNLELNVLNIDAIVLIYVTARLKVRRPKLGWSLNSCTADSLTAYWAHGTVYLDHDVQTWWSMISTP